ncbi:hypothetical protein JD969_05700 [Planctomycetota bacterium]|nr:hypothetical protein JD969_05700 [Planctomycetota bacterium]
MTSQVYDTCTKCQYEFTGLPERGKCPECGNYYDKSTGKGVGSEYRSKAQKFDRFMVRLRTIFLASIAVIILLIGMIISMNSDAAGIPIFVSGLIAFVFILAAILSYLNEKP